MSRATVAAAEIAGTFRSIAKFNRLGGADSMWGRKHVFEEFLQEEHEKDGLTDHATNGAYRFKGMGCYGNIVSWLPSLRAMKRFLDLGYTREQLEEQARFYASGPECRGGIDEGVLASYIRSALKCKQGLDYFIEQLTAAEAKVKAEEAAKNEAAGKNG